MRTRLACWLVAITFSSVLTAVAYVNEGQQAKPPREDYTSGAYMYKAFCSRCHGDSGTGDGVVRDLLRRPPGDLTRMAERAGGVFPRDQAYRSIAGQPALPGHLDRDMPVFADVFRITEGREEQIIKQRIDALVAHLESLQVKR